MRHLPRNTTSSLVRRASRRLCATHPPRDSRRGKPRRSAAPHAIAVASSRQEMQPQSPWGALTSARSKRAIRFGPAPARACVAPRAGCASSDPDVDSPSRRRCSRPRKQGASETPIGKLRTANAPIERYVFAGRIVRRVDSMMTRHGSHDMTAITTSIPTPGVEIASLRAT